MAEYPNATASAMVDNWLLELASSALTAELGTPTRIDSSGEPTPAATAAARAKLVDDQILALLQVLDLVVLYDKLLYDRAFDFTWSHSGRLLQISSIVEAFELSDDGKKALSERTGRHYFDDVPEHIIKTLRPDYPQWMDEMYDRTVASGAEYYFALARGLGIPYWPSPPRAEYLAASRFSPTPVPFVTKLKEQLDATIAQSLSAMDKNKLLQHWKLPEFPGFGSAILSTCSSRSDILPAALALRDSPEACAFRQWLCEVDNALIGADLNNIGKTLDQVNDLIASVRAGFGLTDDDGTKVTLKVGISPSLDIGVKSIKSMSAWFRRKPLHISFLRSHLDRILISADVLLQVKRLFPEYHVTRELRR